MAEKNSADVGLIGLAVMGQNLALNMADHGFKVAVFNRTTKVTKDSVDANPNTPGGLVGCENLADFLAAVNTPRKIVILVKAGPAVDDVVKQLIEAGIEKAVTMHGLRHTYASMLILIRRPIMAVSAYLGHADVAVTMKIYAHFLKEKKQDTMSDLERLIHG